MESQNQQQTIVTFRESRRVVHYHLRRGGYGRSVPLSDEEVRTLRRRGVPIDLPATAPLSGPPSWPETAVPGSAAEGAEWDS